MITKKVSAIAIILMLGVLVIPANAASEVSETKNLVHISKIVVEPDGANLNFTMYYNTGVFTKVVSLIFGAKIIQPSIEGIFANFTNVSVVSIDSGNCIAKFTARDQCRLTEGGWYVYDSNTAFTREIDELEINAASMDGPKVYQNVTVIPMFWYRA